jgi:hypothetical protein
MPEPGQKAEVFGQRRCATAGIPDIQGNYGGGSKMNQELIDVLDAILGPALLGALSKEEIIRDYGNLGLSIIQRGKRILQKAKEEA